MLFLRVMQTRGHTFTAVSLGLNVNVGQVRYPQGSFAARGRHRLTRRTAEGTPPRQRHGSNTGCSLQDIATG